MRGDTAEIQSGLNPKGTKRRGKSPTENLDCLSDDENDKNDDDYNTIVRVSIWDRITLLFSSIFGALGINKNNTQDENMTKGKDILLFVIHNFKYDKI